MNQFIIKYVIATYAAPYLLRLFTYKLVSNFYIQIKEVIFRPKSPIIEYEFIEESDGRSEGSHFEFEEICEEEMESYSVYIKSNNTTPNSYCDDTDDDKTI